MGLEVVIGTAIGVILAAWLLVRIAKRGRTAPPP